MLIRFDLLISSREILAPNTTTTSQTGFLVWIANKIWLEGLFTFILINFDSPVLLRSSRYLRQINLENSLWQTIVIMARHFDTKVDNEDPGTPNVEATSIEA
ncbi:hypothetical protein GIB67_020500 [Kingdonia uniflora]|uniref:Uncharacterized protein n=1 Tax=Kingdonia uniflora TaxID=39325 RepID=A0A7J7PC57_9MAGN|nr:hypothetical protein GIB67_020500 [Kingdonia uniflora]